MHEIALFSGNIYTAGTNFTRPPVVTVATNLNSELGMMMMTIGRCMVTRMKMVIYIMMIMMMKMTIGRRMVATGSGGQEMEQLKLINQPLIYWGGQGSEKFSNPNMKIRR